MVDAWPAGDGLIEGQLSWPRALTQRAVLAHLWGTSDPTQGSFPAGSFNFLHVLLRNLPRNISVPFILLLLISFSAFAFLWSHSF